MTPMWHRRSLFEVGLVSTLVAICDSIFGERPKVLLLGDSITEDSLMLEGWGSRLADFYTRRADLVVRGFGGATSRHLRRLAVEYLARGAAPDADTVKLVIICIGANDAMAPGRPGHVPIVEFARNLAFLILSLREALRSAAVLLVTPPMVDPDALLEHPQLLIDGRQQERTQAYASAALEVARDYLVPAVDLCGSMVGYDGWRSLLSDGLHLSPLGHVFLFMAIYRALESTELVNGFRGSSMPTHYPTNAALLDSAINASAAEACAWPGEPGAGWFC
eukprot:TRINITY_DN76571_c0_g1_i1.p1 TRINITY_DN76571_c0_g1~~TRINITY_DN76571_c0_g1_i1.p1  ORF type:complete len:278 (+),score=39.91 TRINITY_DN76571_c0_g1_i1:153-986(+)